MDLDNLYFQIALQSGTPLTTRLENRARIQFIRYGTGLRINHKGSSISKQITLL
jgi:hypothetical protein